jgi:fructose-bisphosphate aldolase class II
MARITLRQLLDHAAENNYGVPAFNINNMEQALAIMEAANAVDAPVIIQASRGARSYANDVMLKHMMDAVTEIYPHIPVCVHLDHGNEPATCMTAIQAGFTSVMMDGSLKADGKTPATGTTMSASPRPSPPWRISAAFRSKANSACSARWKAAKARRKTATASRASCRTTSS